MCAVWYVELVVDSQADPICFSIICNFYHISSKKKNKLVTDVFPGKKSGFNKSGFKAAISTHVSWNVLVSEAVSAYCGETVLQTL